MGFALVLLVWSLGHVYLGRRLVRPAPHGRRRWSALAVVGLAAVLPVLSMWAWRTTPTAWWARPLSWAGYVSFGLSSVVFMAALVRDTVLLGARLAAVWRRNWSSNAPSEPERLESPQRRLLLSNTVNMGIVGAAASMTAVGSVHAHGTPAVKRVTVPLRDLPPALHGFRIVQITDVHIGPTIRAGFLERVVEAVNEQSPDLIAVTGDLVDGLVEHLGDEVRPLAKLRARYGSYFVTGNHEYYWRGEEWIAFVRELGLDVLINEHRVIEHDGAQLVVAGVPDFRGGDSAGHPSDPQQAVAGAPAGAPRLLLAHQPRSVLQASQAGIDLQLSGHTHGGQYFPFNMLIYLAQPYVRGLHRLDRTWIYVSCGTGYWGPPMRVGAPSEISVIELVPENVNAEA